MMDLIRLVSLMVGEAYTTWVVEQTRASTNGKYYPRGLFFFL